jgi:hypothetical protein
LQWSLNAVSFVISHIIIRNVDPSVPLDVAEAFVEFHILLILGIIARMKNKIEAMPD